MTYHPKSDFLHEIVSRGFLADCTDLQGLDERLLGGPVSAYIGYDLTATSLHIGNLVLIRADNQDSFQGPVKVLLPGRF